MEKFLYFENAATDSTCIPARRLVEMEMDGSGTALDLRFSVGFGTSLKEYEVALTIDDNTGTEVMRAISEEIRFGKDPFIIVADDTNSQYLHASITATATLPAIS
tara:strand:- start:756 stop:1070 length:315 start_codon:yes stop_codon:yes gene_type:complete